jgi:hypothetical protein
MILRRGDGRLELEGRLHHLVEHAVDPVAHPQASFSYGSMWMSDGALLDRVDQDRLQSLTTGASARFEIDDVEVLVLLLRRSRSRPPRSSAIMSS